MNPKYPRPTLVANIEREYFADILAMPRRKDIEFRKASPFWKRRLAKVGSPPFDLRLLNGMRPPMPEATIRVLKVVERNGQFEFHLGRVLEVKHWDRRHERPTE